uniref:BolA family member 2B n=1 Tax=Mastacembelus armatus TaxID=205130 RepID=A0A3Q3KMJ1_9TELE
MIRLFKKIRCCILCNAASDWLYESLLQSNWTILLSVMISVILLHAQCLKIIVKTVGDTALSDNWRLKEDFTPEWTVRGCWCNPHVLSRSTAGVPADMAVTSDHIRDRLIQELGAVHVVVEDTSPNRCAASFKVLVVSPQFEGKPLLQRHRMVNTCLAEELKEIHAFEQKTLTPEQWEKQKS